MNKKILYIIGGGAAFLILLVIILAASSKKAPKAPSFPTGPITLNWWKPFDDSETVQPLIQAYTKLHPNVTINYTKKNIDNYQSDLINSLASGNGPDVFSINNSWLPAYLDKVIPATSTNWSFKDYKDAFVDAAVNDFTRNEKIYGVPLYMDSLCLYYNKDLLGTVGIATPPKTWQELMTDVRLLKRQDQFGYFTRSGVAMGTNANVNRAVDILYLLMLQQGTVSYSQDGQQPLFGQTIDKNGNTISPSTNALSFYTSFASPDSPNYNWNTNSDYSIDAFVNGKAAFLYSYSYTRSSIAQKNPNLNYDVAPVPQPNLDDPSVNFANYWGEVVSKQSKNQLVAWDFLKFISSKQALDAYYSQNKVPSSRKDLISLQAQDPNISVFANANLTAKPFYKPDQAKIDGIFGEMIDNVILRGATPEAAVSQAVQEAGAIRTSQ